MIKIFFWVFTFIVLYAYIGYGILLFLLVRVQYLLRGTKKNQQEETNFFPHVTLIIPAFNEEDFIRQKIENTLSLEYPVDKLQVIFITDGSSDRTPEIVATYNQFTLMHSDERKGKVAAMNRAMNVVKTPYVIFCDANTLLNVEAIKEIVKHYTNKKVGGVAGEKKVLSESTNSSEGGEGLYWKYESTLKRLDSEFYTVVGAAGELFSFRTELYDTVEEDTLLDDFIISLRICQKGYRVVYEKKAYAMEKASSNIQEEQKRKIRISAGAFQSMLRLIEILNVFRYPKLSFQYISHRVLRWAICPFVLPLIFFLNYLLLNERHVIYYMLFVCQIVFYLFAFLGWKLSKFKRLSGFLNFPFYFVFMNVSLYMGLARFIKGNQSVIWEKAKRNV